MNKQIMQQAAPAQQPNEKSITYKPLGENAEITLTISSVANYLAAPTASGARPSSRDVVNFMMLCKARELNPWAGDAFLVGYDTRDGPKFSLITAQQALLKRAENNPNYDGMTSGVIVRNHAGSIEFREGDFVIGGEVLIGGWAKVFRSDRKHPSYDALNLDVFDSGYSRWKIDPAGMIVKCAESSALRKAFPTQLGGLYTKEEGGEVIGPVSFQPAVVGAIDVAAVPAPTNRADALLQSAGPMVEAEQQSQQKPRQQATQQTAKPQQTKATKPGNQTSRTQKPAKPAPPEPEPAAEEEQQYEEPDGPTGYPAEDSQPVDSDAPPFVDEHLTDFANAVIGLPDWMSAATNLNRLVMQAKKEFPDSEQQILALAKWKRDRFTDFKN